MRDRLLFVTRTVDGPLPWSEIAGLAEISFVGRTARNKRMIGKLVTVRCYLHFPCVGK